MAGKEADSFGSRISSSRCGIVTSALVSSSSPGRPTITPRGVCCFSKLRQLRHRSLPSLPGPQNILYRIRSFLAGHTPRNLVGQFHPSRGKCRCRLSPFSDDDESQTWCQRVAAEEQEVKGSSSSSWEKSCQLLYLRETRLRSLRRQMDSGAVDSRHMTAALAAAPAATTTTRWRDTSEHEEVVGKWQELFDKLVCHKTKRKAIITGED